MFAGVGIESADDEVGDAVPDPDERLVGEFDDLEDALGGYHGRDLADSRSDR